MDRAKTTWYRDERVLKVAGQLIFVLLFGALAWYLIGNMLDSMRRQGLTLGFGFLRSTAGFDIGETLIPYSRSSSFFRAFLVGLLNTLQVSAAGIVLATLVGFVVGVARLSTNFLVRGIARVYIEFLRNVPLLVFLIFLYIGVFIKLPRVNQAVILPGPVYLTNRGVAIPWGEASEVFPTYLALLAGALAIAVLVAILLQRRGRATGRPPLVLGWSAGAFVLAAALAWIVLPTAPLSLSVPQQQGLRLAGGLVLSPEFMALLTGLVIYTSAFIADVVRSGIQAIPRGQVEAAHSLGLSGLLTLRLIILPQALRVIVPPLTSQYLNLTKNSSLAVAIGFPELFHVSGTILNQSGRTVEMITLAMATYLLLSLLTSAFMNWYNQRVRLVER